jgi:hypothetical protein
MNWLKRKLAKWVRQGNEVEETLIENYSGESYPGIGKVKKLGQAIYSGSSNTLNSQSITFQVYSATGGSVVEVEYYDDKLDRHYKSLHIIPSDQDLGDGISKIITIEMLKK